jgi:hypothetical protein
MMMGIGFVKQREGDRERVMKGDVNDNSSWENESEKRTSYDI